MNFELNCKLRPIRELECGAARLQLQARLEEEEEQWGRESLANCLRDEKEDQRLEGANAQSTSYQADTQTPMCNTIQTTERSNVEQKENLNVPWVQWLCDGESDPVNKEKVKSIMLRSLAKLGLPRFDGNPLEWPTFILLFKCLVHDQPLTHLLMEMLIRPLEGFLPTATCTVKHWKS